MEGQGGHHLCQFPSCKYSHHGQLQTINMMGAEHRAGETHRISPRGSNLEGGGPGCLASFSRWEGEDRERGEGALWAES